MSYVYILPAYIAWHYGKAYRDMLRVWTNFIWFAFNFFSITILLKTFFTPFERIVEKRARPGFHAEDIAEAVMITLIMRLVGAMVRSLIIIIGILAILVLFVSGVSAFVIWTLFPFVLVALPAVGIAILV